MIAMIKSSPKCEAVLKQGQEREQIKRQLLGPLWNGSNSFESEFIHSFIYSHKYLLNPSGGLNWVRYWGHLSYSQGVHSSGVKMGTKTLPKQCGKHSDTETHFSVTSSFKKKKIQMGREHRGNEHKN